MSQNILFQKKKKNYKKFIPNLPDSAAAVARDIAFKCYPFDVGTRIATT